MAEAIRADVASGGRAIALVCRSHQSAGDVPPEAVALLRAVALEVMARSGACCARAGAILDAFRSSGLTPLRPQSPRALLAALVAADSEFVSGITLVRRANTTLAATASHTPAAASPPTVAAPGAVAESLAKSAESAGLTEPPTSSTAQAVVEWFFPAAPPAGGPLSAEEASLAVVHRPSADARAGAILAGVGAATPPAALLVRMHTAAAAPLAAHGVARLGAPAAGRAAPRSSASATAAATSPAEASALPSGRAEGGCSADPADLACVSRDWLRAAVGEGAVAVGGRVLEASAAPLGASDVAAVLMAVVRGRARLAKPTTLDFEHATGSAAAAAVSGRGACSAASCLVVPDPAWSGLRGADGLTALAAAHLASSAALEQEVGATKRAVRAELLLKARGRRGLASLPRTTKVRLQRAARRATMLDAMAMRQLQVGSACWGVVETSAMASSLTRGAAAVSKAVAAGMSAEEMAETSDALRDALDEASEVADAFAAEMTGAADEGATDEDVERELAAMELTGTVDAGSLGIPGATPAEDAGVPADAAGGSRQPAAAAAEAEWALELPPVPTVDSVPSVPPAAPPASATAHVQARAGPSLA